MVDSALMVECAVHDPIVVDAGGVDICQMAYMPPGRCLRPTDTLMIAASGRTPAAPTQGEP